MTSSTNVNLTTSSDALTTPNEIGDEESTDWTLIGAIIGGVVGFCLLVVLIIVIVVCISRRNREDEPDEAPGEEATTNRSYVSAFGDDDDEVEKSTVYASMPERTSDVIYESTMH